MNETVAITLADGSACELMCPSPWNGYLVSQPDLWEGEIDFAFQDWLAAHGFASVRHTRDVRGWDIGRGVANHHEATAAFEERFGTPERGNIVLGGSMGGLLTRVLIEQDPDAFVGAIPIDGGGAGLLATFNRSLDMAFVISHLLCPDEPLVLVGASSGEGELERLSAAIETARTSPAGRARLALAASIGAVPVWSDPALEEPDRDDVLEQADQLIGGMARTIVPAFGFLTVLEGLVGGCVVDNRDVDYGHRLRWCGGCSRVQALYDEAGISLDADLERLSIAPRVSASESAKDAATRGSAVTAAVRRPVFVLKSLGDPDASVSEENAYLAAAERAGTRELVRIGYLDSPGHLNSTLAERATALTVLVERIESGSWQGLTSPRALNARAEAIAQDDRWDFTLQLVPAREPRVSRFVAFDPWPYPRS